MTEGKWLRCEDPKRMLLFARSKVSDRRVKLCWCGGCRATLQEPDGEVIERAVRLAERDADGEVITPGAHSVAANALSQALDAVPQGEADRRTRLTEAMFCLVHVPLRIYKNMFPLAQGIANLPLRVAFWMSGGWWPKDRVAEARIWCGVIRCIVGNPFRPVAFSPSWRTDTAVALARQMYESRDFGAMPILADALQDAGCDSEDILAHCRDPKQVHVRGCWVVDLVLGKV